MSQISPPIRIILVAAVALLAAWMLFLRPQAETVEPTAATEPPLAAAGGEAAQSAAGAAVEHANAAKAATEGRATDVASAEVVSGGTEAPARAAAQPATATPAEAEAEAAGLPRRVRAALAEDKVVVLLLWSPRAADDRAVRAELADVDRHGGKVVVEAAPIRRIARFQRITRGANVAQTPTVVVVDRDRKVETLVGYADHVSIDQLVTDALRNS
jgi:hypothetical protein